MSLKNVLDLPTGSMSEEQYHRQKIAHKDEVDFIEYLRTVAQDHRNSGLYCTAADYEEAADRLTVALDLTEAP